MKFPFLDFTLIIGEKKLPTFSTEVGKNSGLVSKYDYLTTFQKYEMVPGALDKSMW